MQKFIDKLARVRRTREGIKARCPSHRDKTASLYLSQAEDKILIKCFAGCKIEEIVRDLRLEMSDLFLTEEEKENIIMIAPAKAKLKKYNSVEEIKKKFKNLENCYEYFWTDDELPSHVQIRYKDVDNHKQFATYHRDGENFYEGKGEGLTPLYNLKNIESSKSVLIVEGEKVVDILSEYGIPATTSLGGSNNAHGTDWTPLMNKSIVFWRDNDDPGLKYQESVDIILSKIGIISRKVDVDKLGLNKGDDLEEYINSLEGTKEEIKKKIYSHFPPRTVNMIEKKPVEYLKEYLTSVKSGEIKNYEVPFFPLLTKYVRAFKPGSQVVIYSAGGVGKSMWIGRMCDELNIQGEAKVRRLHLENKMSFYLLRSLSQQSCKMKLMEEEFHKDNPLESDDYVREYEDKINIIGEAITTTDSSIRKQVSQWDYKAVMEWMTENSDADIIIIDPVSMVLDSGSPWLISTKLTKHAEELMSINPKLCVVWIQHTADSSSDGNIGGISGGKAWNRYSSSVLNFVLEQEPDMYEIQLENGDIVTKEVEVYIKVKKARSGKGGNWKLAMYMDDDLSYKEMGRMLKKIK